MTLNNVLYMWEVLHPSTPFLYGVVLPSEIDKDALMRYITGNYGSMQPVTTLADEFRIQVVNFFIIHDYEITKLCATLSERYNPMDNYRYTEKRDLSGSSSVDSDSNQTSEGNYSNQNATMVSAFNEIPATYPNFNDTERDRQEQKSSGSNNTSTSSNIGTSESENETVTKTGHTDGKSFQELINEERKVALFNIYKVIAGWFCSELLVSIW